MSHIEKTLYQIKFNFHAIILFTISLNEQVLITYIFSTSNLYSAIFSTVQLTLVTSTHFLYPEKSSSSGIESFIAEFTLPQAG